jgi:oxepin-CoA hydrolase/3-oxo-5,6-dehydrosuberyl-CoA semialdehyde dehydrogenase
MSIQNYILGKWENGEGVEYTAKNAITGAEIGTVSSIGLDYESILEYGRKTGGPALRKMTFQER